MCNIPILVWQF